MTNKRGVRQAGLSELYGINRRNVELVHAFNRRDLRRWADDKLLAKDALLARGVAVPRTLARCRGLYEVEPVVTELLELSSFVVKPARGSRGRGILVIRELAEGGWLLAGGSYSSASDLGRHLADIVFGAYSGERPDVALIEECVHPHPFLFELWPGGLCDVRVLVLEGRALMAMARVPTERSRGRANLHQGGIGIAVDLETGVLERAVLDGCFIDTHPETGTALVGRALPNWGALLATAESAAQAVPLGYLGVDLTLDREGNPLVIELNARPGLEIQNVVGLALGHVLPAHEAFGGRR